MSIYEYDEERQRRFDKAEGMEEGMAQGMEQGMAQGETRFAVLTDILLENNKVNELKRATKDKEYRNQLYEEYGI